MPLDFTIVIPFYDGLSHLSACVHSLRTSGIEDSSIIIVRNSPHDHPPIPNEIARQIKIIDLNGPAGYAKAINAGIDAAQTSYICLCDADSFLTRECVEDLVKSLADNPELHLVGPTLLDPRTDLVLDCGIGLRKHGHFHPWLGRSFLDLQNYMSSKNKSVDYWPAVCSAVLAFRKDDFHFLGGMDESYIDFFQDVDFCLRAGKAGFNCGVLTSSSAYHNGRSSGVHTPTGYTEMTAHHFSRHGKRWLSGVESWLDTQLDFFKINRSFPKDAVWANLSSLADPGEFTQTIDRRTKLQQYPCRKSKTRDSGELNLFSVLGYDCLQSSLPVIYFVDMLSSLQPNQYWIKQRHDQHDIVIDRHCNVVSLDSMSGLYSGSQGEAQ